MIASREHHSPFLSAYSHLKSPIDESDSVSLPRCTEVDDLKLIDTFSPVKREGEGMAATYRNQQSFAIISKSSDTEADELT